MSCIYVAFHNIYFSQHADDSSHPVSVSELADLIDEKPISIIKFLMTDLGVMASMTQNLDPATCIAVAEGFGRIVGELGDDYYDDEMREMMEEGYEDTAVATGFADYDDDEEDLRPRSPVITIIDRKSVV